MEFNKNLLINDNKFWIDCLSENKYLLKIINIEDFYQLVGNTLTLQYEKSNIRYIDQFNIINNLISIFHIKSTYLEYQNFEELIGFKKNDLNKLAILISKSIIKQRTKGLVGNELFIAYALINKLLSIEENITLLNLDDGYYTNFLLTDFKMPLEEFNRIFYKELTTSYIYITRNIHILDRSEILKNDLCVYNLLIPTEYYKDNRINVLLKIATRLQKNNLLVFSLIFPEYYYFSDHNYIDDKTIKKDLNDNIEALTDILKIPMIEMKKLIETNILG